MADIESVPQRSLSSLTHSSTLPSPEQMSAYRAAWHVPPPSAAANTGSNPQWAGAVTAASPVAGVVVVDEEHAHAMLAVSAPTAPTKKNGR